MSIIGRIIGLLLVVALAFGITWCATHWSKVQAESQKVWDKLFGKQEQVQPTPNEEQFSLDGLYYTFDFDGYVHFFRFKDNQFGNIEHGGVRGPDEKTITEIYLPSDWETQELTESYHTTEDEEYIRAYCKNPDGQDFVFAIYDKATKKLYYDFSNGEQLPGKTYEEQMLIEMIKFDKFVIHDHVYGRRDVSKEPTCTESGVILIYCEDCHEICNIEYPSSLGHNYVGGKCTRCGESDPNYVEEVSSIDGLYYRARTDGTIDVFQIEGAKYANFVGYTQNGDESKIYLTQGWETYIEQYGYSLTIAENDTQIICGVPELMERYKDNEQMYEVFKNYFIYDKTTKELSFGMNKVVLTRIEVYDILPYEEPRIYVENNVLHLTDMTGIGGTYTVYYRSSNTGEEGSYVAGNVTEFDLTVLFNHDPKLVSGDEYTIRVVFATDGFLIRGCESIQYIAPNGETALTWTIKQHPQASTAFETAINFTSNNEAFNKIQIKYNDPPYEFYFKITYINSTTSTNKVVFDGSNAWESYGEAYRTITFETAPTGDLLAWLQANATPQV